mmetsp:Transcript_38918/g.103435  ORF Transcript_38918/g.103435 Transcript_38918/m.103435 type:complete len:221 (+) Transcript_38918:1173-1835(+)
MRNAAHQMVGLEPATWHGNVLESSLQRRDHSSSQEWQRIQEFETQRLRNGEVFSEKFSKAPRATAESHEETIDFHWVVPHRANRNEECDAVTRTTIEQAQSQVSDLVGAHPVTAHGVTRHEERLKLKSGSRSALRPVVEFGRSRGKPRRFTRPARSVHFVHGNHFLCATVAAELVWRLTPHVHHLRLGSRLQEVQRHILTTHAYSHMQRRPTSTVCRIHR